MRLIFGYEPSLRYRIVLAVLTAIGMIVADSQFCMFSQAKIYVDTTVSSLYFLSSSSRKLLDNLLQILYLHNQLELENRLLRQQLFLQKSKLLVLEQCKKENVYLRELLCSPLHVGEQRMVTQVIHSINDYYSNQVIIDKGSLHGIYEGQPVVDNKGVVGQVIAVGKLTSRVLLINDVTHALPVQVFRNNIRVIASGNGCNRDLKLDHLPIKTDIRVGDVLVTSGLGCRFPEGYPVAIVSSVKLDTKYSYVVIQAQPTAELQHLNYLLLLWISKSNKLMTPKEVHHVANSRLIRIIPQILNIHNHIKRSDI